MNRPFRGIFLAFAIALAGLFVPTMRAQPQQPVSVAFLHSVKPFVVIPVSINGHGPYPFVLDTGSNLTAVDAPLFKEINLQENGALSVTTLMDTELKQVRGIAKEISISGLAVRSVEIIELKGLSIDFAGRGVRGILGENFLDHFDLLIDNEHRRVLFDEGDSLASGFEGEHLPMSQTSFHRTAINHGPVVSVILPSYRSSPLRMLLDTGTNALTLFPTAVVQWNVANAGITTAHNVDGEQACATWNDRILWGKLTLRGVQAVSCKGASADKFDVDGYMPTYLFKQILISHTRSYVVANPVRRSIQTSEMALR